MTEQQSPENSWLIIGPPGTGKTTYVQRQATRAAQKYGSDKVMLSSFTRGAAHELADRQTPINRDMIGTLHHFAYQALGHPKITESLVKEWNKLWAVEKPGYVLSESLS